MILDVKLKGLPNEDLVQGYPGIPATWPRVAGTVEVRYLPTTSKESCRTPFQINKISVTLLRTDSIVVPSHRPSMAAQKREKSFLITRQKEIFRAASETVYALDVPFTLSLPTKKPPCGSILLPKTLESTYSLYVTVETISPVTLAPVSSAYQFPIRVRRFDTLATFGVFSKPARGELSSADHLVDLQWSLPVSAYGPGDCMKISLRAQPNMDWPKSKKVKLKRLSCELVQVTKYTIPQEESAAGDTTASSSSGGGSGAPRDQTNTLNTNAGDSSSVGEDVDTIETRTRIAKTAKEFSSSEQDDRVGMTSNWHIELPIPSFYHAEVSNQGVLAKENPAVGYCGRGAFTNASSLFNIEFRLVLKARLSNAKDIEAEQSVTISQFNHLECMVYMNSLVETAQRLKYLDARPQPPRLWLEPLDTSIRIV